MKEFAGRLIRKGVEWVYRTNERAIYYPTVAFFEKDITNKITAVKNVEGIETVFKVDLHGHSVCSDGVHTPQYVFGKGIRRGLNGVALTDHDTLCHYPYCKYAQEKFGKDYEFIAIPGTEYTTTLNFGNRIGIAHLVGINQSYEVSKPILRLIEKTKEVKKDFLRNILTLGREDKLPIEEVMDTLKDENHVIYIPHPWSGDGVRGKLPYLLNKYPEACVEVFNPRSEITFPDGIPDYVINHKHLCAASDSHFSRETLGDAFTCLEKTDILGSDSKPSLEKLADVMRKGKTKPYLVPLNSLVRNLDKCRYLHATHDMRSVMAYFDDERHVLSKAIIDVLVGKEVEQVEDGLFPK